MGAIAPTVTGPALAASACSLTAQGEGRVGAIIDARTFRMDDGREVRLAGIETLTTATRADSSAALRALAAGRSVTLRGETDAPDRYGRQPAFVFVEQAETSVQNQLLAQGDALVSGIIADKACAAELTAAEAAARRARLGIWADPMAIKNAESPGDILARIGQFTVVEGKVLSVRQAGATTYLNFGRRWTRDFAVTISRRMWPAFEAAGIAVKSLENKRIRVRGWIEARPSPRIEALQVGQIEMAGEN
ncbi:thermonuclease family protein [Bradyrhizobium sp.]